MEFFDQVFDQIPDRWDHQLFEQCTFRKLKAPEAVLSGSTFVNCRFEECDLSKIELKKTKLNDVFFVKTRLMHVDFSLCDPFALQLDFLECQLDYTVFLNRKLKKTRFVECSMKEAHFLQCDLAGALFKECNLELAKFSENNLTQADFATSYNLRMNLDDNKVKKARFSLHTLPGLLVQYDLVITT